MIKADIMNKIILAAAFFFIYCTGLSQTNEFWGMTEQGGAKNLGVIFSTKDDGSNFQVRYSFTSDFAGNAPSAGNLVKAGILLYGLTTNGGTYNKGVLFSYNPASNEYIVLYNFKYGNNSSYFPVGGLTVYNNKLYGFTNSNDANGNGSIFEFDIATSSYTNKKIFTGIGGVVPGSAPLGTMYLLNNKLYGVVSAGGQSSNSGVFFEYDPVANSYSVKRNFAVPTGWTPSGELLYFNNEFYGTTQNGGANSKGVIYKYNLSTDTYTVIKNFGSVASDGQNPAGGVVEFGNKLYGLTPFGGSNTAGILYELDLTPPAPTYTIKYNFPSNTEAGGYGKSKLIAVNNFLYGTTSQGTNVSFQSTNGSVFKYDPSTSVLTTTYLFSNTDGKSSSGFFLDGTKLYAASNSGGITGEGVLYEYDITTEMHLKKFNFNQSPSGRNPGGTLLYHNTLLYGLTKLGGNNNGGVLFSFNPSDNVYTVLYHLSVNDGYNAASTLIVKNNILYGVAESCYSGGIPTQDYGCVFNYDLTSNIFQRVVMNPNTTGIQPNGSLLENHNAEILGISRSGTGAGGSAGRLFQYVTASNTVINKANFSASTGGTPDFITRTTNNKYFITCRTGGTNSNGSVVEYSGGLLFQRAAFNSTVNGREPIGQLIEWNNNYYGMTSFDGGSSGQGTIFSLNPSTFTITKLHTFNTTNGKNPTGSLLLHNNKLYGLTYQGGTNSLDKVGILFEFDPLTNTYSVKKEFDYISGAYPPRSLIVAPTGNVVTPLDFLSFTAQKCNTNQVCLSWKTANEQNVSKFEIERSTDGRIFNAVKNEPAKNAISNNYNSVDDISALQNHSKLFYRLKQVDIDGRFTYSSRAEISLSKRRAISVYPNPASDKFYLTGYENIKLVQLFNADGKKIKEITVLPDIEISNLANGLYYIKMLLKSGTSTELKFIKR